MNHDTGTAKMLNIVGHKYDTHKEYIRWEHVLNERKESLIIQP